MHSSIVLCYLSNFILNLLSWIPPRKLWLYLNKRNKVKASKHQTRFVDVTQWVVMSYDVITQPKNRCGKKKLHTFEVKTVYVCIDHSHKFRQAHKVAISWSNFIIRFFLENTFNEKAKNSVIFASHVLLCNL